VRPQTLVDIELSTCQPKNMQNEHALAVWRKTKNLSQQELAAQIGVTRWMVNRIETGKRKPSLDLALRIQELTEIAPAALVAERESA
jgi:putative transcriptional regulator